MYYRFVNVSYLVSWCFQPSQPQRITSGLNTNFTLSPIIHFTSHHTTSHVFLAYLYSVGTQHGDPASSRVTYFILRAYTGTGVSHSQHRKKSGQILE